MSIISAPLPDYVDSEGKRYGVRTDFRVLLRYYELIHSGLPMREKLSRIFHACYIDEIPPKAELAMKALAKFYACVSDEREDNSSRRPKTAVRHFDFEADAGYIYAAFMSEYGINLQSARLHWWEFMNLFSSLGESCRFSKIVSYRMAKPEKIKNPEQKKFIQKMQRIYKLPDLRSLEEKESGFADALWNL